MPATFFRPLAERGALVAQNAEVADLAAEPASIAISMKRLESNSCARRARRAGR